ncbi:MAG: autotransporter domain-containing protein [Novosphingobium sp.]|nr:autotransporter domain-containing protein [Novosphingobium sp.]
MESPIKKKSLPRLGGPALIALLSATALTPMAAFGQNGTWLSSPGSSDFNTVSNWSSGSVPTGTATFGSSTTTNLTLSNGVTLGAFQFNAGAPAYTFNIGTLAINFTGTGIVNNSSNAPTFTVNSVGLSGGTLTFNGSGTSAGNAIIVNSGGNSGSTVYFNAGSTAGNATIVNNGAGANTRFVRASLGDATIIASNGGSANISDATSGNATTIANSGGGNINFQMADLALTPFNAPVRVISNAGGYTAFNVNNITVGSIEGAGRFLVGPGSNLTVGINNLSTTVSGTIEGSYGVIGFGLGDATLTKVGSGTLTLTGAASMQGGVTVSGGALIVNSSLLGNTTVGSAGTLGGSGVLTGNLVNSGTLAPGNVGGTFTVTGNLTHNSGATYRVGANAAGQSDRVNVGGIATLNGGTVQVVAASGSYSPSTTYTILNAAGGVSGTYSSVNSNFAFLVPSLNYDANNVYLTLITNFANSPQSPTQNTLGQTLNMIAPFATGDLRTVLGALSVLSPSQVDSTFRSISGQNLSSFSTTMVQGAQMFMNNLASQAGSAGGGNRVMMAEACAVACDDAPPAQWGAWGGAVGGLGTIGAGQSVGAVTYNAGGFAAGLDRRFGPSFLAGVTVGFTTGTQWVSGFDGKGTSDTYQVGLYGSFTQDKFYLDGFAGYGYSYNQSWRNILIPGLQPRTAMGQAGANQLFGQFEAGYRFDIGGTAQPYVTPFARLQGYTATQNAYTESGAQSLNLNVASVTTNSLRSVLGAVLGAHMNMGWRSPIAGPAASAAAGSVDASAGLSVVLASVALSATGGRLTGGLGFILNGTGAWFASTVDFVVCADATLAGAVGASWAVTVFSVLLVMTGGTVAGCACGHGEATPAGAVVSRLALATPAAVIIKVATRMPRFICRPEFSASPIIQKRHPLCSVAHRSSNQTNSGLSATPFNDRRRRTGCRKRRPRHG